METIGALLQTLLTSLEHLGVWAYLVIFLIALADSTVVIGTFTAGGAFLLVAGFLTARGVYGLPEMIVFATLGSIIGGIVSYQLGRAEARFEGRKHWFPKEAHLERGGHMLAKRGGFSLFIARFLGPLSSIMAFVAGTARMPLHRFMFWNAVAGIAWGAVFVTLGWLVGNSVIELHLF